MHKRISPHGDFDHMGNAGVDKEKDILEKYNISNIDILKESSKIYRTDLNGSMMIKIKNNKLRIETCSFIILTLI